MEENHTFDNHFGDFPGVGAQYAQTLPAASNPAPHDIDHSGPRTRYAIDGGAMDGFDPLGDVQYKKADIPVYWAYAQNFGLGTSDLMDYFNFSQTPDPKLIEAKVPYSPLLSVPNVGSAAVSSSHVAR